MDRRLDRALILSNNWCFVVGAELLNLSVELFVVDEDEIGMQALDTAEFYLRTAIERDDLWVYSQMPGQEQMAALSGDDQAEESDAPKLGLMLSQLTPEAREQFELPAEAEGVVVTDVQPGSPAAEKGLQRGDVIVEADRKQVSDPKAIADAVREAAKRGDDTILLLVQRDGQNRFVAVGLERA